MSPFSLVHRALAVGRILVTLGQVALAFDEAQQVEVRILKGVVERLDIPSLLPHDNSVTTASRVGISKACPSLALPIALWVVGDRRPQH